MFGWGRKEKVELQIDRSPQVLALSAPENYSEPALSPVPRHYGFLSASVLAHKAKQVDDRIYAAVERAVTPGILAILKKTKVWAFLGWSDRPLTISFAVPPRVEVVRGRARVEFGSKDVRLAFPVCEELYVTRILNRDEFRAHCDRLDQILSSLLD